jgi:hypothetical protein
VPGLEKRAAAATAHPKPKTGATKATLLSMLSAARKDTNKLLGRLRGAGSPSGSGGKSIAKSTREAFDEAARAITESRKALQKVKAKDAAGFVDQTRRAQDVLESSFERVEGVFANQLSLDKGAVLSAFNNAACGTLSETVTAASATPGPQGEVSIAGLVPPAGPPGTVTRVLFANVDAAGQERCEGSSAYRVELLGPNGAQLDVGGLQLEVPQDAPAGVSSVRVVCYFPGRYGRPLMRSLCSRFEVTAGGAPTEPLGTTESQQCPPTGRVLMGSATVAAQRALGEAINQDLAAVAGG